MFWILFLWYRGVTALLLSLLWALRLVRFVCLWLCYLLHHDSSIVLYGCTVSKRDDLWLACLEL